MSDVKDHDTLERVRDAIADTMEAAAHSINEQLPTEEPDADSPAAWGLATSEWLERLSEDVRQWDTRAEEARIRRVIARNPGTALLVAGVAGLLLGRAMWRR
jgi:hypothetical protein